MGSVVDFHSHILPGIDDGSDSVEMSMAMLRREAEHGVRAVVATPHFYPQSDAPERFLSRRADAQRQMAEAVSAESDLPLLHMGAEAAYFRGMSHSDALQDLRIGDTRYIMIELPLPPWSPQIYTELSQIRNDYGLTPIIAHVERYMGSFTQRRIPDLLAAVPALLQVNAGFFLRRATAKTALRMLREGKIHLLGTDCHNLTTRPPNLSDAVQVIEQSLGSEAIRRINHFEDEILGS